MVSSIVTLPNPKDSDKVRVYVDMRQANTTIQRECHITPTIDDIIHELKGATVFSKIIDLTTGYHQLELHLYSRYTTTFTRHLGLRHYKCLNFEISSVVEMFQNVICKTLQGIKGMKNLSHDIRVHCKTQADHDNGLRAVIQRLEERGITFNQKMLKFNKSRLELFGFIFSAICCHSASQQPTSPNGSQETIRYGQLFIKALVSLEILLPFQHHCTSWLRKTHCGAGTWSKPKHCRQSRTDWPVTQSCHTSIQARRQSLLRMPAQSDWAPFFIKRGKKGRGVPQHMPATLPAT